MKTIYLSFLFSISCCLPVFSQSITSTELKGYCMEINAIQFALDSKTFVNPKDKQTYQLYFSKENFDVLFSSGLGYKAEYMASVSEMLYVSEGIDLSVAKGVTAKPVNPGSAVQVIEVSFPDKSVVTKVIEKGKLIKTTAISHLNFYYLTGNTTQKTRLINALNGIIKLLSKNSAMYHQLQSGMVAFPDGTYTGSYIGVNKRREGIGKFVFKDGSYYTGEWENDKMHGKGEFKSMEAVKISGDLTPNRKGVIYKGEWVEGKIQGKGTLKDVGIYYEGNFVDGRIEGNGSVKYTSSGEWTYDGEWKDFKFHGKGIRLRNGGKYEGEWKDGMEDGKGIFTASSGAVYDGEWKYGKEHGYGIFTAGKSKYVGQWRFGERHGTGEYIWDNGDKYNGSWKYAREGKGIMQYANGDKYDGEWRSDRKYEGTYIWKNGNSYSGEWSKDTMHGKGTMVYASGERYEGEWRWGSPSNLVIQNNKINKKIKDGMDRADLNTKYLRAKTESLSGHKTYFVNYILTDSTLILYVPKNFSHKIYFNKNNDNKVDGDLDLNYTYVYPQGYYYKFFAMSKGIYRVDDLLPSHRDSNNIMELVFPLTDILSRRSKVIALQIAFDDGNGNRTFLPKRKEEIDFAEGKMYYIKLST